MLFNGIWKLVVVYVTRYQKLWKRIAGSMSYIHTEAAFHLYLFVIAQRLKDNILLLWLLVSHIVVIISKRVWPMVCVLRLFLAFDAVEGVHVLLERLPCRALHLVDDYPTQLIYIWISIIQRRNIYVCFIRVICSSPCRWRRLCRQSEGWGGGRGYRSQRRDLNFF